MLVVSYLQSVFGVDVYGEFKNRAARLTLWAGFLACQMVVMGTSADILPSFQRYSSETMAIGLLDVVVAAG